MAEGGIIEQEQRLSLTSGSEFVYDFYCELCWDDGLNEEADGFCVECKDYLCITCIQTHRKSRPTRQHDVLDKDSMPKDDPLPHDRVCKGISTKCKLHSKATVVFYCSFHDTLGCSECLLTEHRTCPDIESIDAKSEQILDSLEYKDLVRRLNDMEQKSRDMILKTRANVATTVINFSNAVEQIRKIREEVMVHLDDLELYLITELEILTSEDKEKMRRMEEELLTFSEAVDQFKTDVQTLASSKRVCQLFIQIKTKKNEMSTLECNIRKVEGEQMCARMFKFEPNNEIRNVLTTSCLGKIVVQDRQSEEAETSVAEERRNIRDIPTEHVSDTDIRYAGDRDLELSKYANSAPTTPTTILPLTEISDKLHYLIVVQGVANESVVDWIKANVEESLMKEAKFIRALMTAVCNSAIKGNKGKKLVEPKEINTRNDLLQKYIDQKPDSELHALYALQVLVVKLGHPRGVLRQMFDTLYDEDIISEDAFIQWEKSEEEPEGKSDALKQVVEFFKWLHEAEDDIPT